MSQGLIDASLAGNYSALTELHHVDYYASKPDLQAWLTGNIDYARQQGRAGLECRPVAELHANASRCEL